MSVPSRNVTFSKPAEPSFLKAFKSKVGYKEPDGIEAKRPTAPGAGPAGDDKEEVEREDELPTVVVLREGDIGQEEFLRMRQQGKKEDADTPPPGVPTVSPRPQPAQAGAEDSAPISGRITFKKPAKRRSGDGERGGVLDASSGSKRPRQDDPSPSSSSPKESAATVVVGGVTRRRRRSSGGENKSRQVKNSSLLSFGGEEEED